MHKIVGVTALAFAASATFLPAGSASASPICYWGVNSVAATYSDLDRTLGDRLPDVVWTCRDPLLG